MIVAAALNLGDGMKLAQLDIYTNYPFLVIGSSEHFDGVTRLLPGHAIASSDRHVLVATIAQVRLVRVSLWEGTCVSAGSLAFDGEIRLDRKLCVTDALGANRLEIPLERPGVTAVAVLADTPGAASCVDVVIGGSRERGRLTELVGFPLPPTFGSISPSNSVDEIALILADIDMPVRRLAAAMKVMRSIGLADSHYPGIEELSHWMYAAKVVSTQGEAFALVNEIAAEIVGTKDDEGLMNLARTVIVNRL